MRNDKLFQQKDTIISVLSTYRVEIWQVFRFPLKSILAIGKNQLMAVGNTDCYTKLFPQKVQKPYIRPNRLGIRTFFGNYEVGTYWRKPCSRTLFTAGQKTPLIMSVIAWVTLSSPAYEYSLLRSSRTSTNLAGNQPA